MILKKNVSLPICSRLALNCLSFLYHSLCSQEKKKSGGGGKEDDESGVGGSGWG